MRWAKVPAHTAGELRLARTRVLERRRQVLGDITLRAVLDSYETALVALRSGGARLLELSATTGLGQRLVENDALPEAAARLGAVYETFSEGHDTPVLRNANAVLQKLR